MIRPYIICQMMSAVNGKCSGAFYKLREVEAARRANAAAREFFNCSTILYGAKTMAESYGTVSDLPHVERVFDRQDYLAPSDVTNYMVSIDPEGTVALPDKYIVRNGRPKAHVIQVLTEAVSDDYLTYLRQLEVSYLFAGERSLDLPLAMEKLRRKWNIQKLIIAGGGIVNQSFLAEGLIDEISLVLAPACSCDAGTVATFEPSPFARSDEPVGLRLLACETREGGAVWLRYAPANAAPIED